MLVYEKCWQVSLMAMNWDIFRWRKKRRNRGSARFYGCGFGKSRLGFWLLRRQRSTMLFAPKLSGCFSPKTHQRNLYVIDQRGANWQFFPINYSKTRDRGAQERNKQERNEETIRKSIPLLSNLRRIVADWNSSNFGSGISFVGFVRVLTCPEIQGVIIIASASRTNTLL